MVLSWQMADRPPHHDSLVINIGRTSNPKVYLVTFRANTDDLPAIKFVLKQGIRQRNAQHPVHYPLQIPRAVFLAESLIAKELLLG